MRGTLGRGQAPGASAPVGISGVQKLPLRLPTIWAVPGDGPARAIAYGVEGSAPAVELIEIDGGRVVWRDSKNCAGPVVGVTATTIVCADAKGTRGIDVADGSAKWETSEPFLAMDGDRITIAGVGTATIRGANEGGELGYVKLPAGVLGTSIVASCGAAGRELFAIGQDGKLQRIVDVGAVVKLAWATPIGPLGKLEACDGASI
ncbi:MAG: hypothetical protein H0T79_24405, partial [Deltaproteobacteria bacterium]|nr:hypothetical protein [Deltaproteobacteria bacterium]